jgi:hypothetical protein
MERSHRLVVGVLVALGPLLIVAPPATGRGDEDPDKRAVSRLDAMADFLGKAKRLRATIDSTWDVTQSTGEKIEFGETRVMTIRRPDRARVEVTRRDGGRRGFLFDGTQLAVFDLDLRVYATAPRPGTLDAALDYFTQDLNMRMPLRELVASDLPKTLAPLRDSTRWVGAETVAGVATEHLFLRGDGADLQFWIPSQGDPLPRRIVITYRQDEGQPQFRANFTEWNLSPDVPDELFAFAAAEGAEKIPFVAPRPAPGSVSGGKR